MTCSYFDRLKVAVKARLQKHPRTLRILKELHSAVVFPRWTYQKLTKNGTFRSREEVEMCSLLPVHILTAVIDTFSPKSVLDVGCGTGMALDLFLERGIDVVGLEGSKMAIAAAKHPERIQRANLNNTVSLNRMFDVVWSFEVAEHIHPKYVDRFLQTLVKHSDIVVMSAAQPGQGGYGHFNEQPLEYWIKKFHSLGYNFDAKNALMLRSLSDIFSENMMVFRKAQEPAHCS